MLNKNQQNLDNSLRLMAPFYRVFANTLGNGPWFDTYIQNLPARCPDRDWEADRHGTAVARAAITRILAVVGRAGRLVAAACSSRCPARRRSTSPRRFPRTVSLYEGSDVRILGVPVGKVETVGRRAPT